MFSKFGVSDPSEIKSIQNAYNHPKIFFNNPAKKALRAIALVFTLEVPADNYRSDLVNWNTVKSNFHLSQTFFKFSATLLSFQC